MSKRKRKPQDCPISEEWGAHLGDWSIELPCWDIDFPPWDIDLPDWSIELPRWDIDFPDWSPVALGDWELAPSRKTAQ